MYCSGQKSPVPNSWKRAAKKLASVSMVLVGSMFAVFLILDSFGFV